MRPLETDYAPYYKTYIDKITGEYILKFLYEQTRDCQTVLNSFPENKGNYSYAQGKWSVKEVIGHIMDTERIFTYRALSIARGEKQPLPGFEQDDYVKEGKFGRRDLFELVYELRLMRESNLLLYKSFNQEILDRRGTASGFEVTVNALLFMIAGHMQHHLDVLKEKYL